MGPCGAVTGLDYFCCSCPLPPISSSYTPSLTTSSLLFLRSLLLLMSSILNCRFCLRLPAVRSLIVSSSCLVLSPQRAVPQVQRPAHLPLSSAPLRAFLHLPHWCGKSELVGRRCTMHSWQATAKNYPVTKPRLWWYRKGADNFSFFKILSVITVRLFS